MEDDKLSKVSVDKPARGVAKLISAIEQYIKEHPEDCENGMWVRNLPKINDVVIIKNSNDEQEEYKIGIAFYSLKRGRYKISDEQQAKLDDLIDYEELHSPRGMEKLIQALISYNDKHPEACDNGKLVRNFPFKSEYYKWVDSYGKEQGYFIGDALRRIANDKQEISVRQKKELDKWVDLDKYKAELQIRHNSKGRRSDFCIAVEQYIKLHPEDCKDGKWVRNFLPADEKFSWVDENGDSISYDLGMSIYQASRGMRSQEFITVMGELIDLNAYEMEREKGLLTTITISGAERLIYVIKEYIKAHPEDCYRGVWIRNPPRQKDKFEFINEFGEKEVYNLGKQLSYFRQGKIVATPEQYERVSQLMPCMSQNLKCKKNANEKKSEKSAKKLTVALIKYNEEHPDDCENGKLVKNFPIYKYKIDLINEDKEKETFSLGKAMYNVKFARMDPELKKKLFDLVDWEAYRTKKSSKSDENTALLATDVVNEAIEQENQEKRVKQKD
ncbi:MAG: hypothetical protein IKQ31_02200 [Clostridia bacterium]|nr:hypothetical protein [Clostridia bacterium]